MLYSYGDVLEEQSLDEFDENWAVLNDPNANIIDGLPLIRWSSTMIDNEKLADINILTRTKRYVLDDRSIAIR